jgi:hypothetical protein
MLKVWELRGGTPEQQHTADEQAKMMMLCTLMSHIDADRRGVVVLDSKASECWQLMACTPTAAAFSPL